MRILAPLDVEILKLNVTLNLLVIKPHLHLRLLLGPWESITGCSIIMSSSSKMKIVMSSYLGEKWSHYDEIWHNKLGDDCDKKFQKLFITM